jgi:hypothetical protein
MRNQYGVLGQEERPTPCDTPPVDLVFDFYSMDETKKKSKEEGVSFVPRSAAR